MFVCPDLILKRPNSPGQDLLEKSYLAGVILCVILLQLPPLAPAQTALEAAVGQGQGQAPCEQTNGLVCDGLVATAINLYGRSEGTVFPESISALTGLTSLDLKDTKITSDIPDAIFSLSRLRYLRVVSVDVQWQLKPLMSSLTGLERLELGKWRDGVMSWPLLGDTLRNLTQLTYLALFYLGIDGQIPPTLGLLTNLVVFDFGYLTNQMNTSLPTEMGQLRRLTWLKMSGYANNRLNLRGPIPDSFSALTSLMKLEFRYSNLSGSIPSWLGTLTRLTRLTLTDNALLTGQLPASFGDLQNLRKLQLTGTSIVPPLPASMTKLTLLSVLDLPPSFNNDTVASTLQMRAPSAGQLTSPPPFVWWAPPPVSAPPPLTDSPPAFEPWPLAPESGPPEYPPAGPSPPPPPVPGERVPLWCVAVMAVLSVALVAAVGLALWQWRLPREKKGMGLDMQQYTEKEVRAFTGGYATENKLGQGSFGEVYKGLIPREGPGVAPTAVAVKRQQLGPADTRRAQLLRTFQNEAKILASARHRNLVGLQGYCCEGTHLTLLLEFVPHGSLSSMLRPKDDLQAGVLSWAQRLDLALGAARGLQYLHHEVPHEILHLDIKSDNILVDANLNAKVADFGISKINVDMGTLDSLQASLLGTWNARGTPGYMDPYFYTDSLLTRKSDVYSFGIVLLEIATSWPAVNRSTSEHIVSRVLSCLNSDAGLASLIPPGMECKFVRDKAELDDRDSFVAQFRRFVVLALWCCAFIRDERPTMHKVLWTLTSIVEGNTKQGNEGFVLSQDGSVCTSILKPEFRGHTSSASLPSTMDVSITNAGSMQ